MTHEFLNVEDTPGPRGAATKKVKRPKPKHKLKVVGGLEDATGFGKDQARPGGAGRAPAARCPRSTRRCGCRAPCTRARRASTSCAARDGKRYGAYRMVLQTGHIGEYYGLQGITWKNPPILEGVTEKRKIGGRTYELAYDGDRLRLVAWHTPKAVYWISNTLLQSLDEKQMLAIARSVRAL